MERVLERWQKLVDAQAKVALTPTGMICSNALVVEGNGGASGKGKGKGKAKVEDDKDGLLEKALAQSEESRRHLADDNMCLRMMFVKAVNEIYAVAHEVQGMASQHSPADQEVRATITFSRLNKGLTTLFTLATIVYRNLLIPYQSSRPCWRHSLPRCPIPPPEPRRARKGKRRSQSRAHSVYQCVDARGGTAAGSRRVPQGRAWYVLRSAKTIFTYRRLD